MMRTCGSKDLRAVFRGFCRALDVRPPSIRAVDETRYINMEVAALTVYQYFDVMLLFQLWRWGSMTAKDKKSLLLLFSPERSGSDKASSCRVCFRSEASHESRHWISYFT